MGKPLGPVPVGDPGRLGEDGDAEVGGAVVDSRLTDQAPEHRPEHGPVANHSETVARGEVESERRQRQFAELTEGRGHVGRWLGRAEGSRSIQRRGPVDGGRPESELEEVVVVAATFPELGARGGGPAHDLGRVRQALPEPVALGPPGIDQRTAELLHADVHGADEPHPALVVGQAPAELGADAGDEQDGEYAEGPEREDERHPAGGAEMEQRRMDGEADEGEQWQHHPAAHALEHDRSKRPGRVASGCAQPADANHVTADRRRQHAADEHPGEVLRHEGAQTGVQVEDVGDSLPAGGCQSDREESEGEPRQEPRQRAVRV